MTRPNHADLNNDWREIAKAVDAASKQLDDLHTNLLSRLYGGEDKQEHDAILRVMEDVQDACDHISGLSYLCTPQTEWLGGDSSDSSNHIERAPHIVCDRK